MKHLIFCTLAALSLAGCGKAQTTDADSITKPMSGAWTGTGSYTFNGGSSTPCQSMSLTLSFTATDVTVSNVSGSCSGSTINETNLTLQYTGSILYYNGTAVGNIDDSSITANINQSGITDSLSLTLTDPTHMTFTESGSGGGNTISMAGTLTN